MMTQRDKDECDQYLKGLLDKSLTGDEKGKLVTQKINSLSDGEAKLYLAFLSGIFISMADDDDLGEFTITHE